MSSKQNEAKIEKIDNTFGFWMSPKDFAYERDESICTKINEIIDVLNKLSSPVEVGKEFTEDEIKCEIRNSLGESLEILAFNKDKYEFKVTSPSEYCLKYGTEGVVDRVYKLLQSMIKDRS